MERTKGENMRYFSAFSGVGGFDLGMPANWECIGMSEINKQANMVLKYHFKDVKNYGDIEKINYEELPDFELLIGGSPCQDISIAGKRAGLAGIRSRLFFSYVALLKSKKPQYFIFENVKGLLSSNNGWDFAEVANQFSEAGYDIWWQVLDAADFGIPQHRERIFIFGALGGSGIKQVFFEPEDKRENTGLQGQKVNTITGRYGNGLSNGSYITEGKWQAQGEKLQVERDRTGGKIRLLTPLECERLMGWPDNWTRYGINEKGDVVELSDNARYNLIGNGVVPQVVRVIIEEKIKDL